MVNFTIDQLREIIDRPYNLRALTDALARAAREIAVRENIANIIALADEIQNRPGRHVASMSSAEVLQCIAASTEGSEMDRLTIEWNRRLAEAADLNARVESNAIVQGLADLPMPEESKKLDSRDDVSGQRL